LKVARRPELTQTVDTNSLTGWQVHHLALEREVIALFGAAHDALSGRTNDLDAEVIQLKRFVGHGVYKESNVEPKNER
jgi:hypothetical protein